MDFGKLTQQAKKFVDDRGGTKALGDQAKNLGEIAKGKGSLSDKAKQAAASAKEFSKVPRQDAPGATTQPAPTRQAPPPSLRLSIPSRRRPRLSTTSNGDRVAWPVTHTLLPRRAATGRSQPPTQPRPLR